MRRLHPQPAGPTTPREAYALDRQPVGERPWTMVCMVASIDGSAAIDGLSGGLSNAADREVLATLRSVADLVLVGAGTARAEGYGPPSKDGQRIGVVTKSGNLDPHQPLFRSGAGFLVMPVDAPQSPIETVRAGTGEIDLAVALTRLPGRPRVVQVEGGPALNGALAAADLIDEVNLTISPRLAGGDASRIVASAPPLSQRFDLAHVLEDDGFVFTRYVRDRA